MEDFQLEDLKAGETRKALIPLNNSTLLLTVVRNAKKNSPSFMELDPRTSANHVVHLVEAGILILLLLASIICNGLVFLLFYRKPSLINFSSRFILNLSVSHLLQSLLVIPFIVLSLISDTWLLGSVWCQFSGLVISFLSLNTVLCLLLIALDRNCAVNSPLHYTMTITKKKTEVLIAGTWLVSLLATIPPLLGVSKINYRSQWHACTIAWNTQDPCSVAYGTMLFVLGFLVPLIKMTWIYCSMFYAARTNSCRARKHSLNNTANEGPPQPAEDGTKTNANQPIPPQTSARKRPYYRRWSSCSSQTSFFGEEWKAVTTGFLVVFTFIVCWLPYYTLTLVEVFTNLIPVLPDHMFFVVILLSLSSCVINPYLYVFRNKSSRKHVKNIFRMKNGLTWFSYLSCQRDATQGTSSALQSANQKEQTTAIPVLFRDKDGHWQIISTSGMRSRDDAIETVSNISDECFEPDISEAATCNQQKDCQEQSRNDADILSRVYATHGNNIEFYSFRSVNRMLIFQLKSRKYRNYSSSSDTTDNGSTSFESTIGNDDYLNWSSNAESVPNSRGSTTALLIRDNSDSNARPVLKRFSSFVMEENEFVPIPAISHLGFSRRHSFILTHHRNTESSETTLTSSTNSESQDFVNTPPVASTDVRPQLLRQSNCIPNAEDRVDVAKHGFEWDKGHHS